MIPKFRAWDSVKKEMFKDTFAITEIGQVVVVEQKFVTDSPDYVFVNYLVIMQSTGLKDKNGKDIFEGDVLEIEDEGEVLGNAKLTWDKERAVFMIEAISVDDIAPFHEILSDESYSYRVVGNIYENPELLEKK